jgi:hypothetical protein
MSITVFYGAGLMLIAVAMIWNSRPAKGQECAPFLRSWLVGQLYVLAALVSAVMSIGLMVSEILP